MSSTQQDVGSAIAQAASAATLVLLKPSQTTAISGIRVFDVGQGDCIGIQDQNGDVFCYVDYGGAFYHPDKINPAYTPTRLPISYAGGTVSIILTHWDKDHYYSAYKKNPAAQGCEWLAPRQWASPFAVRFAAKLTNAKCWPETLYQQPQQFAVGANHVLEICKCASYDKSNKKQNRNTCGLAIILLEKPGFTATAKILLAGDCHFDGIPYLLSSKTPIRGLVAFHHGSTRGWTSATQAIINNAAAKVSMVYSYGISSVTGKNLYGHPHRNNYQPTWDANAETTPNLRSAGKESEDISW